MPETPHLTAVPDVTERAEETVPAPPEPEIGLLAALDAGDEQALRAWVAARAPGTSSLVIYTLLLGVGLAGLVEWPAVLLTALAQVVVDTRLGGLEKAVADLRAALADRAGGAA